MVAFSRLQYNKTLFIPIRSITLSLRWSLCKYMYKYYKTYTHAHTHTHTECIHLAFTRYKSIAYARIILRLKSVN